MSTDSANPLPQRILADHLPNAWRLHSRVISGGLPEGDEAFAELVRLGVKTVISVDGAQPDLGRARRYGLRYVHLPHGYDGISDQRGRELAKAVRDLPGPIYIHCHHGKHRSPAAAAVACVVAGLIEPPAAVPFLQQAGTSENYRGLYASASKARVVDRQLLDRMQVEFPESAELPPMASAMVAVARLHDGLNRLAKQSWTLAPDHPDLDPAHEALLLREHFAELLRSDEVAQRPDEFHLLLTASELHAGQLEQALSEWFAAEQDRPPESKLVDALNAVTTDCKRCHAKYRDVPQS